VAGMYTVLSVGLELALARFMGVAGIPLAVAVMQFIALGYLLHLMRARLAEAVPPSQIAFLER